MTVTLVLVAHVAELAEGVRRLAAQMAPDVPILTAGGTDDGDVGTSFDRVLAALEEAHSPSGTVVLYDLGSALLTAETAVEMLGEEHIRIVDAPLVEGALAAATEAQQGADLAAVAAAAQDQGRARPEAGEEPAPTEPGPDAVTAKVTLRNPLGLHARPAADLARLVTGAGARVLLTGSGHPWVDARSVVAVTGLGLHGGDEVTLAAEGAAAAEALDRVTALVASGFGEAEPGSAQGPATLSGVAASPGVVEGPAVLVVPTTIPVERAGTIDTEAQRLASAIDAAGAQLQSAGQVFRPIAAAHQVLLNDPMLRGRASALVGRGQAATQAWSTAVDEAFAVLSGVADVQIADRAADVLDVGNRVAAALLDRDFDAGLPDRRALAGAVVVADDLLPSQVVRSHEAGACAVVAARGGATAHAAQLARSLGIPAVLGVGEGLRAVSTGERVRVDGHRGLVEVR